MLRSLAPVARNVVRQQVRSFGKDFAQGMVEDQVKDWMGKPQLQTGQASLGGGCAGLLRKAVKGELGAQSAHTPFQAVARFQAKGFTPAESLAIIEGHPERLVDSTIQRLMGMGMFGVASASMFQREKVKTRDPLLASAEAVVTANQRLQNAKDEAERAKFRAAQPISFFLAEAQASKRD